MKQHSETRQVKVMGIDLAKNSLQVYGVDGNGRKTVGKKMSHQKLKEYVANLPVCTIAMEACASAHYRARLLKSYGHEVKLIAPRFVKPYVKSNKNDAADAEAVRQRNVRTCALYRSKRSSSKIFSQSIACVA